MGPTSTSNYLRKVTDINEPGHTPCGRDITLKDGDPRVKLETVDVEETIVKEETPNSCDEDSKNYLPDKLEDVEGNEFKCEVCRVEFMKEKHLSECPYRRKEVFEGPNGNKVGVLSSFCKEEIIEQHTEQFEIDDVPKNTRKPLKCHSTEFPSPAKDPTRPVPSKPDGGTKKYKCTECDYSANWTGNLKRHVRVHTQERRFKCDKCEFATNQRDRLNNHWLVKHSHEDRKHKCKDCEYSTSWKEALARHMRAHANERPFKCDKCEYAANERGALNIHILAKHSDKEKKYKCGSCRYSSHRNRDLVKHMRTHADERPFKCDQCEYAANEKAVLNTHILAKHSNEEKKYKCSDCQYASHRNRDLLKHMCIHAKERPFKCDKCEYAAKEKGVLNSHILAKHNVEEKKYKCEHCEYSTHVNRHLVKHMRIHTNDKPFNCDQCEYVSYEKALLYYHRLAKHSNDGKPYKCTVCEYSTHVKRSFVVHMRIHSNDKPFKCDVCNYAAIQRVTLKRHILTKHSDGEKRYKCADCTYSTNIKNHLVSHVRVHDNKNDNLIQM